MDCGFLWRNQIIPEVILFKAVHKAWFKVCDEGGTVSHRGVCDGDRVDGSPNHGLTVQPGNDFGCEWSTAQEQVADTALETETTGAWPTSNIEQVELKNTVN